MYSLNSKLYVHAACDSIADAAERVARVEAAMGQRGVRFADRDVPDLLRSVNWQQMRSCKYGEHVNPPDTDIALVPARFGEVTEAEQRLTDEVPGQGHLARLLFGRHQFGWFTSGCDTHRRPNPQHVCRPAWRLNTMNGCPHQCAYCSLSGVQVAHVNLEEYGRHLAKLIEHNPWETVYLFNDCSDTLVLEPEIDNIRFFIDFFKQFPDRYFVVHTKSANVDHLLEHDHQKRCVMLFTVTGPTASRRFEPAAPTCEERLEAARKCYQAGYPVRIKFKPIIPVKNWREDAETMARLVTDGMKPEVINLFTIAWMDFEKLGSCFPLDELDPEVVEAARAAAPEMKGQRVGPLPHATRAMIYNHFIDAIRRYDSDVPITFSTESLDMWKELGPRLGYTASDYICGCGARAEPGMRRLKESPWAIAKPVTWDGQPVASAD